MGTPRALRGSLQRFCRSLAKKACMSRWGPAIGQCKASVPSGIERALESLCYGWSMFSNPALDRLTDQALLDQFGNLVQQGHHHTLALLRHIDVIDRRKLWAKYGHPSMFDFCVSRHHMSSRPLSSASVPREPPGAFPCCSRW